MHENFLDRVIDNYRFILAGNMWCMYPGVIPNTGDNTCYLGKELPEKRIIDVLKLPKPKLL